MTTAIISPLTIILPVYNESKTIQTTLRELCQNVITKLPGTQLIIFEDGSTDGTQEILLKLKTHLEFSLVSEKNRKGYTQVLNEALDSVRTGWILFMDSDAQHRWQDIFTLIDKAKDGNIDIVSGCKHMRCDPLYRRITSWGLNYLTNMLFHCKFRDINSGFKLIKCDILSKTASPRLRFKYCPMTEFMLKMYSEGYSIEELPVAHSPRLQQGSSIFTLTKLPFIIADTFKNLLMFKSYYQKRPACISQS